MSTPVFELIQGLLSLLKEETSILASPEDAAYFRTLATATPNVKCAADRAMQPAGHAESTKPMEPPSNACRLNLHQTTMPTASAPLPSEPILPANDCCPTRPLCADPPIPQNPTVRNGETKSSVFTLSSIRPIMSRIAPETLILDAIPSDAAARKIANRWKTKNQSAPISILSGDELPQHKMFLQEIALALDVYFGPAKIVQAEPIEKEKQWEAFLSSDELKLIIVCDSTLWQLHHLRPFYKETPNLGTRTLGKISLFLLPDLSLYLKDPLLKKSLWKALCQRLNNVCRNLT